MSCCALPVVGYPLQEEGRDSLDIRSQLLRIPRVRAWIELALSIDVYFLSWWQLLALLGITLLWIDDGLLSVLKVFGF